MLCRTSAAILLLPFIQSNEFMMRSSCIYCFCLSIYWSRNRNLFSMLTSIFVQDPYKPDACKMCLGKSEKPVLWCKYLIQRCSLHTSTSCIFAVLLTSSGLGLYSGQRKEVHFTFTLKTSSWRFLKSFLPCVNGTLHTKQRVTTFLQTGLATKTASENLSRLAFCVLTLLQPGFEVPHGDTVSHTNDTGATEVTIHYYRSPAAKSSDHKSEK